MKFTRKFLDGYITYDEDDAIVHANSIPGYIFKSIWVLIYGTVLGVHLGNLMCCLLPG